MICGITIAASSCAFAFTDAELIAAGDGFDSRRDAMLASQVAKPYPAVKPDSPNVWGLQDYALAALYINKELPQANKAVIDAVDLLLGDATQMNSSGHWKGNLFFRIYRFFAHDSKYFPGRLTPAAEAKICEFFWEWAKSRSKISHADIDAYQTWSYWGSENHDGQRKTTAWSAASILKDVAPYNTYTYDDGSTAQQQYDALTAYAKEYLSQRAKKGLCIEIGTPTYTKYTLQGWYNYYDFAEDQQLKKITGMILDLWWADWAESQINSVWGGGKSRVYKNDSTKGADSTAAMSWYYLNIGSPKSKHPGVMCMATTTHRLPLVVMDIALDISGRGVYEKRSRRPGLKKLPVPASVPAETNICDPDFGGNARYTYVRPEFIIGTCMVQKRSYNDWTGISMQNRWHGAIFANHRDSRVFPAVEGIPVSYGKTYNPHWSVQNKGTLITQKIAYKHNGDMRVYFSSKHLKISESHGCVFADTGDAYVAVRPAWGSYKWDDKNWIRFSDPFAPAIMEVAVAEDYNKKLSNFIKAVLSKKPSVSKGILTYTGVGDSGTFTFDTKGSQTPTVNGVDVDYAPKYTFKSPFMNEDWASGVITIKKDGREKVLDFTKRSENTAKEKTVKIGLIGDSTVAVQSTAQQNESSYESTVKQRIDAGLKFIQKKPWPDPTKNVDHADSMALLLLFKNENVEEANRLVLAYCGRDPLTVYAGKRVPKVRCESLFRIYLLERTRQLLSAEARKAIENHAWELLTKYNRGITLADADKRFWGFKSSENHYLNDRRRYTLALQIVRMAKTYGPQIKLEGETVDSHCRAWLKFWCRYFRDRANEGIDIEVAHPSSYGMCTAGVYYDIYDLFDDAELHALAGNYLTLFWAEVASEFEPRTGQRAGWASTRNPNFDGKRVYWAQSLLYCYNWHDNAFANPFVGQAPFITSSYRPPEIVSTIARDRNRGCYLTTCRRPGLLGNGTVTDSSPMIFDKDGNAHIRRDVYYTPDYALSTLTYDPDREYRNSITLAQAMGVTFASDQHQRITVMGSGYYPRRAINGITGPAVSIISRDPKAAFGVERFKSTGTRVFISNGDLWDNRLEDASGWFFTHTGSSYVAIRPADKGYSITTKMLTWPKGTRKIKEVEKKEGHFLELKDMWAPLVIQMARAVDYKSFEAFCAAVKDNRFVYDNEKLSYVSQAKDKYEYWAKIAQPPQINGVKVNLNPTETYDTPYLSMIHGESKAIISYKGYKDLTLDFTNKKIVSGQAAFERADKAQYETVFSDSCTGDWTKKWFLDGQVGTVMTGTDGMELTAGAQFKNDSHHMVLWTKDSFKGDLKIEYEYTRLDSETRCVNILYIQATGSGEEPYAADISKWNDLRKVPSMKTYFNHMNTYHISYSAFPNVGDSRNSYIRARRYMPNRTGLKGTDLEPDYYPVGLFEPGVKHRITVIKKDRDLYMRVQNPEQTYYCHMTNPDLPIITEGRIGLRHMFTRSAKYKNFRISTPSK